MHKGKVMKKADVVKAAEDITKVIEDGKQDDESVKTIIAGSKTHGGLAPPSILQCCVADGFGSRGPVSV